MQRILLLALLFVRETVCSVDIEEQPELFLEDASLLLHNLSQQHFLWQCNATTAPSNANRLASCQQTTHGEAETVPLKLPTLELLAELLEQLRGEER